MVKKIEHIGIIVADLESSLKRYTTILGLELEEIEEVEVEGTINRVAFLPLNGISIELVHTTGSSGLVADFQRERSEGIHHIAFEVENLKEKFEVMRRAGVNFLWDKIISGSRGTRAAFIDPEEFNGVYIELIEKH